MVIIHFISNSQIFSKVVVLCYTSLPVYESCDCSTYPSTFGVVSLFNFSHSGGCIVASHCGLICISQASDGIEPFFVCLLYTCALPFVMHLFKSLSFYY